MAQDEVMSWSDIENELKKYTRRTCTAAAGKVRDDLYKEACSAINDFYNHYKKPKYYNRHEWNFRPKEHPQGEGNAFRKLYDDRHEVVWGGIELTPQLMDDVYQDDTQEVFDTVFAGFHGVAGMFVSPKNFSIIPPRMVPSPMQRLLNLQKEIEENPKKYIDFGKKVAKRECLLFRK